MYPKNTTDSLNPEFRAREELQELLWKFKIQQFNFT